MPTKRHFLKGLGVLFLAVADAFYLSQVVNSDEDKQSKTVEQEKNSTEDVNDRLNSTVRSGQQVVVDSGETLTVEDQEVKTGSSWLNMGTIVNRGTSISEQVQFEDN